MRAVRVVEIVSVKLADDEVCQGQLVAEEELAGAREILLDRIEECWQLDFEEIVALLLLLNGVLLEEYGGRNLGEEIDVRVNNPVVLKLYLDVGRVVAILSGEQSENTLGLVDFLAVIEGDHGQGPAVKLGVLDVRALPDGIRHSVIDEVNLGVVQKHAGRLSPTVKVEVRQDDPLLASSSGVCG